MPDITMCQDADCPQRATCHRFTAQPDRYQGYFATTPRVAAGCGFYWPTTDWQSGRLQPVTDRIEYE